jgi:UDP-glucose 4-epimerase
MQKKRVLVTGGAGFVGSHVAERLASHTILSVLDDFSRGSPDWVPDEVDAVYRVDVRDEEGVLAAFADFRPTCVLHLAALHFIPAVDDAPEIAEAINVSGTQNIANAAVRHAVEQIVFASTAAVYPDSDQPLSEEQPVAPIDLYGRTKVAGEQILRDAAAASGASTTFARLFNVVGHRETNPHVFPEIVEQLRAGADELALGNVDTARDFIDARDVASALERLLELAPPGVSAYNVGSGRAVSVRDIVAACITILGTPVRIRRDPERVRAVDRKLLVADNRKLRSCGWRPQYTLEDTLAELLSVTGAGTAV